MLRLPKIQTKTLSTRLSLMVVSAVAVLLLASLAVMFHFSRQAVKQEALKNAMCLTDKQTVAINALREA